MWRRTSKTFERAERAEHRELRLEEAGVPRTVIDELTARVDLARRLAPDQAERLGLDELLDIYADLAIAAHAGELARVQIARSASESRRNVRIHALAWRSEVERFAELAEEVAELTRLSAAIAVMPIAYKPVRADEAMCGDTVSDPRIDVKRAKFAAGRA
jgi:hypothetical protein